MFRFRPRRAMALLTAISLLSFSPCALAESSLYPGAPSISDYSSLSDEEKAAIPLINASHPLPEGFYLPQVEGRAQGGYSVKNGFSPLVNLYAQRHSFRLASSDIWLCRHVYEAAQALFAEAEAQDVNGFIITSGYRSRARQQEIYDETPAGYAALPGQSEHETGLCFDVTAFSDSGDFGSTPQYAWLIANCWDYGFILRYPEGTSDVTGIQGESWHFRYVGEDAGRISGRHRARRDSRAAAGRRGGRRKRGQRIGHDAPGAIRDRRACSDRRVCADANAHSCAHA